MTDRYAKATPFNDCAFLVQGEDAEIISASTPGTDVIGRAPNWWCVWGETQDTKSMPPWVSSHVDSGGPNFSPQKHCPNCPAYQGTSTNKGAGEKPGEG